MVIDLTTLADDRVPVKAAIPAAALDVPAEDFTVRDAAGFEGVVERLDEDVYRLEGRVQATLSLPCARCAEPFDFAVDAPVDLRFVPATAEPGSGSNDDEEDGGREIAPDDPSLMTYEAPRIDLVQVVREQCYLAVPMKPLCRPDCQGLCPQCGVNRNVATCTCENRWEDPRLAGLKSLLKDAGDHAPRE